MLGDIFQSELGDSRCASQKFLFQITIVSENCKQLKWEDTVCGSAHKIRQKWKLLVLCWHLT